MQGKKITEESPEWKVFEGLLKIMAAPKTKAKKKCNGA